MQIRLTRNRLPLAMPVVTAKGPITERVSWVVQIDDGAGRVGLGEAAPLPEFGTESLDDCKVALHTTLKKLDLIWIGNWLMRGRPDAPLGKPLEDALLRTPCARAALEGALIDLMAQQQERSVAHLLLGDNPLPGAGSLPDKMAANALVSGGVKQASEDAKTFAASGFTCFKLKLSGDVPLDLERVFAVRDAIGTSARLRVDANGSYDSKRAHTFAVEAGDADLEYCEQPLPVGALEELAALRRQAGMVIAVDEEICTPADVGRVATAQAADVVVLKPAFLGGWRPTKQATELARRCGLDVVITTVFDGAVGRAHATHAAAALGLNQRAHGLSSGILLAEDLTTEPLTISGGFVNLHPGHGLGIGRMRK